MVISYSELDIPSSVDGDRTSDGRIEREPDVWAPVLLFGLSFAVADDDPDPDRSTGRAKDQRPGNA